MEEKSPFWQKMWKLWTAHMGWTEPDEEELSETWKFGKILKFFSFVPKYAVFMPSLICPPSVTGQTHSPKATLMLCTWLLLCCCYIHKLLVILGLFVTHVGRWNFLLAAGAACRAELLHLEWHFGGWALQVNRMSKVQPNLCSSGVVGLLLSSCTSDLALSFCSFANSLHWLSVPFQ